MASASLESRRRSVLFAVIIASCVVSSLQETALATALPPMIRDLGVSVAAGQWLTSGYNLAMGIVMPTTAFLIMRVPTKRLYVGAIALFTAGIAIASVAGSFPVMMAGRVVQACGNAVMMAIAQVIILTIFPADQRGQAMGMYGLAVGAAPVIAPSLAGVVVDMVGWRWIFWGTLAVSLVLLACAIAAFDDVLETREAHLDLASFALSTVAFGGVTLGVGNVATEGLAAPTAWAPLALGLLSGIAFTRRQLALSEPFLDIRMLANRRFRLALIGSMLLYFVMMGGSMILPLYVQNTLGDTATTSSFVMLPGSLVMAVVNPFAGRVFDRIGMRPLWLLGGLMLLVSCAGMVVLPLTAPVWISAVLNALRCVAIGCLMMPLVTWGCGTLGDSTATASGSALLTALRTVAGAIGSALFTGVMQAVSTAAGSGAVASMAGVNAAFASMAVVAAILFAMGFRASFR